MRPLSIIKAQTRPFVILNAAMSLDGKIATWSGDSKLSSPEDLRRVHELRARVDGIMVGQLTVKVDDPSLRVKLVQGKNPRRIIVDSLARTKLSARVVRTAHDVPTIFGVTAQAPEVRVRALEKAGVIVLRCGNGHEVSLSRLLRELRGMGLRRILLEGGGKLNWSMLNQGLVDEVSVAISPRILGGEDALSLVEGRGVGSTNEGFKLRLIESRRVGHDLLVRYRVLDAA